MMNKKLQPWQISIAPMVNWSTPQMRYLWRQLCANCLLYTEMTPINSIIRGRNHQLLEFREMENPLALQVAGNDPEELALVSKMAEDYGYDEVNLNLGCPSCKLAHNGLGAAMIKEPELTADCLSAMVDAVKIPISLKTRLGVDDWDDDDKLHHLINLCEKAGVARIIMHARKAWLKGVNPKQNRTLPPLQYERAAKLQEAFPKLPIVLNGGIDSFEKLREGLDKFAGVMIGRWAYREPLILKKIAADFWGEDTAVTTAELVSRQLDYAQDRYKQGEAFRYSGLHLLNLYAGQQGARKYRQQLSNLLQQKEPPSFSVLSSFLPS